MTEVLKPALRLDDALQCARLALLDAMDTLALRVVRVSDVACGPDGDVDVPRRLPDVHKRLDSVRFDLLMTLVRHVPKARPLREVTAMLAICTHLERAFSQCDDIVALSEIAGGDSVDVIAADIARMSRAAEVQVWLAQAALRDGDPYAALAVREADQDLNQLNRRVFRTAVDAGDNADAREWAMAMTMIARAFERIGDNAVDIAEQVVFVGRDA
jgi:phosphate transport system protein